MNAKLIYVSVILTWIFLPGCGAISPPSSLETLYLQEIEVTGPINQPPIHLTDNLEKYSISLTPSFSYLTKTNITGKIDGHSRVNYQGFFQVDTFYNNGIITFKQSPDTNKYIYDGENFFWDVSTFYAALDFDFRVFKNLALFAGINYSLQDKLSIWGGSVGFGLFTTDGKSALRLDVGLQIQEIAYSAQNVILVGADPPHQERNNDVYFINDVGKSIHSNPFLSISYNTTNRNWFVNFFLNAGYSLQTTVSFSSEDSKITDETGYIYRTKDMRGESISGFWNITPGLYFYIGESGRLLLGTRFFFETINKTSKPSNFILPMVQFDFRF